MKKLFFSFFFFLILPLSVKSQNYKNEGEPYDYYCFVDRIIDNSYQITLDWHYYLGDEKEEKLSFHSGIHVINYMSKRGWKFVGTYSKSLVGWGGDGVGLMFVKKVRTDNESKEGLYLIP